MSHLYLTADVRDLMHRLNQTLDRKSPSSDNSSTVTFEPDSEWVLAERRGFSRSPVPRLDDDSLFRSVSPRADSASMLRTISCEKFRNTTLRRMEMMTQKNEATKQRLKLQEEQQFQEDTRQFRASDYSKQLIGKTEPLPSRTAKILQERSLRTKELQERLAQAAENSIQPELTFAPKIKPLVRGKMSPSDFYDYNLKYASEAKKTATSHQERRDQRQAAALTLRPVLNSHSRRLAATGGRPEARVSEFLRKKERKIEEMRRALEPSFKPDISATSKKLVRKLMTKPESRASEVLPKSEKALMPLLLAVESINQSLQSPQAACTSPRFSPSFHS